MLNALVTAEITHLSGFPEDNVVNTFAFQLTEGAPSVIGPQLVTALDLFYNGASSTGDSVAGFLSPSLKRVDPAITYRVYNLDGALDGSPHGSPVYEDQMGLQGAQAGSTALPEEVAICLTTRATGWQLAPVEEPDGSDPDAAPDRPRQRLSGRIYLGPLGTAGLSIVSNVCRPTADLITTMLEAGDALQTSVNAAGHNWSVWSRKDSAMSNVTDVQVDNAFDTQRRRGPDATARTTLAV